MADEFRLAHGIDLRANPHARYRLLQACERAKCRLSTEETALIAEEFIAEKDGQPLHLQVAVTRQQLEERIDAYIERTIHCSDEALRGAGLSTHQIDDLVFVGGSTRIPMVERRVRDEFLRQPSRAVDPDLAVALGAAVQAAMIEGQTVGPVLVDVSGHTLGIEACVGRTFSGPKLEFTPIIHRNSPLPASYEEAYSKMSDEQESAIIHVLQGERPEVYRNRSVGKFNLPLKAGGGERSKIVVRFDLTLDGTLKVTATQTATGLRNELVIDNALSQFRAEARVRAEERLASLFDSSEELIDDEDSRAPKEWRDLEGDLDDSDDSAERTDWSGVSKYPEAAAVLLNAQSLKSSVEGQDAEDLEALCENLANAMALDDAASVAAFEAELEDLIFYVR